MIWLFSTPAAPAEPPQAAEGAVIGAIKEGAKKSGADFSYLVKTAQQESSLDPKARNGTSSAEGLFQFVEQTWLATLKTAGPKLGLGRFSQAITETRPGYFDVPDPKMRGAILALRADPQVSSVLAGALTQANGDALSQALGRKPSAEDLYLAHVFGAPSAAMIIRMSQTAPEKLASTLLPEAARVNPTLFFSKSGKARTIAELRSFVDMMHQRAQNTNAESDDDPFPPLAFAHPDGPALYGLFRNIGPIDVLTGVAPSVTPSPPSSQMPAPKAQPPAHPPRASAPSRSPPWGEDALLTEEIVNDP